MKTQLIILYGCEAWTLKVSAINRIEALELIHRRLFKISLIAHVTNEEVLGRAQCEIELKHVFKKRKRAYLGHEMRGSKYGGRED